MEDAGDEGYLITRDERVTPKSKATRTRTRTTTGARGTECPSALRCSPGWHRTVPRRRDPDAREWVRLVRGLRSFDHTAATGGRLTCEPGTSPIVYYYDEDLDGTPEDMGEADASTDCSEAEDEDEMDCRLACVNSECQGDEPYSEICRCLGATATSAATPLGRASSQRS